MNNRRKTMDESCSGFIGMGLWSALSRNATRSGAPRTPCCFEATASLERCPRGTNALPVAAQTAATSHKVIQDR